MASLPKPRFTPEQYLELERQADYKSEYYSGQIFAMAGASEEHNLINVNVSGELRQQLRGRPCRTYASDMRVRVSPTGLYTYPDVIAVCGERHFSDDHLDTLTNPTVIVEVLSPSTELYDRGEKFAHYRRLESLTDYILVAQDKYRVEHYARQTDQQWLLTVAEGLEGTIYLRSIDCTLTLSGIYENVELAPGEPT
jgi:Uma2 family endonuclease